MKRYEYKIYGKNGSYITTWKDVISQPSFGWNINGGLGALTVTLKRPFSNFGEGVDVWFENQLKLEVYDKESPDGRLLYTGRLNEYKPHFGADSRVEVGFVGYATELDDRYLRDESSSDAINSQVLLPSGIQTSYQMRSRFNPDPNSGLLAVAQEFVANHNTITGAGIQMTYNGGPVEKYAVIGIMDGSLAAGVNQAGQLTTYLRPGKILTSGIIDTATLPSGINTAVQQFSSIKLSNKLYLEPGKSYFAFISGSGINVPLIGLSDPGWLSTSVTYGWDGSSGGVAAGTPFVTNTNATSWLNTLGNVIFFSNTSPRYNSQDPTTIMQDVIQNKYSGTIQWDNSNALTGYSVSYQFNKLRVLETINKINDLTDPNWFWYIGPNNKLVFKKRNYNVIDHTLRLGYEINECAPIKSVNEMKTRVLFIGGTPSGGTELYDEEDWWWQNDQYSLREYLMQDGRVTKRNTSKQFSRTYLDAHFKPTTSMVIEVLDSNSDDKYGYDIESFVPGQFVRIIDPDADNFQTQDGIMDAGFVMDETQLDIGDTHIFSEPLQILGIQYKSQSVTLSLGTIIVDAPRRIEDIYRGQQAINTEDSSLS